MTTFVELLKKICFDSRDSSRTKRNESYTPPLSAEKRPVMSNTCGVKLTHSETSFARSHHDDLELEPRISLNCCQEINSKINISLADPASRGGTRASVNTTRPPGAQSAFIKWTGWTLAKTMSWWQHQKTLSWLLLLLLLLTLQMGDINVTQSQKNLSPSAWDFWLPGWERSCSALLAGNSRRTGVQPGTLNGDEIPKASRGGMGRSVSLYSEVGCGEKMFQNFIPQQAVL